MQMRPQGWLFLGAITMLASGCAFTSQTDADGRTARLPTGVTLLDSDRNECDGTVSVNSAALARRGDLVIQPGQNATFALDVDDDDDVEIDWTCVGARDTDRNTAECPEYTSHVRISRAPTGDEFLLECYGDRDGSSARARR